jgi:hypothetical protein
MAIVGNKLIEGVQIAVKILTATLSDENLWLTLSAGLEGAAMKFGAALSEAVQEPLVKLRSWFEETFEGLGQEMGQAAAWEAGQEAAPLKVRSRGEIEKEARDGIKAGTAELNKMAEDKLSQAATSAKALAKNLVPKVEAAIKESQPATTFNVAAAADRTKALRDSLTDKPLLGPTPAESAMGQAVQRFQRTGIFSGGKELTREEMTARGGAFRPPDLSKLGEFTAAAMGGGIKVIIQNTDAFVARAG